MVMDQRIYNRYETRMFVKLRNGVYERGAMVVDISSEGIGVDMKDIIEMKFGDRVEVHSDKLGHMGGQVRWVRGGRLGIRFDMSSNNAAKIASYFKYHL